MKKDFEKEKEGGRERESCSRQIARNNSFSPSSPTHLIHQQYIIGCIQFIMRGLSADAPSICMSASRSLLQLSRWVEVVWLLGAEVCVCVCVYVNVCVGIYVYEKEKKRFVLQVYARLRFLPFFFLSYHAMDAEIAVFL
jgi:hypothetical protein